MRSLCPPRNFSSHASKNFGVGIEPTRTGNRWRTICLPYFYFKKSGSALFSPLEKLGAGRIKSSRPVATSALDSKKSQVSSERKNNSYERIILKKKQIENRFFKLFFRQIPTFFRAQFGRLSSSAMALLEIIKRVVRHHQIVLSRFFCFVSVIA
ncbi:hypothetical protein J2S21_000984 [Peribacillus cavernae]|nr:hypothetical protein [Peribacillus cavernae]